MYFGPDGRIGEHQAGFGQLLLVIDGEGWAAGGNGERVKLSCGQGAYFESGELHSKGSESGMTAIIVQAAKLEPDTRTIIY